MTTFIQVYTKTLFQGNREGKKNKDVRTGKEKNKADIICKYDYPQKIYKNLQIYY